MKKIMLLFFTGIVKLAMSQEDSLQQLAINASQHDTIVDLRPRSAQGNLLRDDPLYNPRTPIGITLMRVTTTNIFNWALSRYVANYDWAHANPKTWKYNLRHGWVWDDDRFGINFIGHPHSGSNYFNVARSSGYSYWASIPFTFAGSAEWEWFGENTRPSKNDLINTTISGAFLGEILYRLSSNILDDRTHGAERVWREILAGIINPTRALNRFTQGKMFRHTPYEVYQKEPLNITVSAGVHKQNENNKFGTGGTNAILNLQLDYGVPFEFRRRRPFDVFRLRLEGRYGDDKRIIDNVLGYGILFGKTVGHGERGTLVGLFQQFDYWNNKSFELGSIGFGPGVISSINFAQQTNLFSGLHLAWVPLAGNNTRIGPDTSAFRDYPFGGGWEARIEERFNIGNRISLGFNGYYYWLFNYEKDKPGKSRIGILKPSITVRLLNNWSLGFEHHVYYDNRFLNKEEAPVHIVRTEQKLFLQLFIQSKDRSGKYH